MNLDLGLKQIACMPPTCYVAMVSVSAPITCLCHLICQATANSLRHDGNVVADNERSIGHAPLFEGCDCNKRHDVARAVRCRACVYVLTCNYF